MHGLPDSATVWRLADTPATATGIRLIAPNRPGFRASTPKPERSILDWIEDNEALTDHLGLSTYRLLAISGGPYALAREQRTPTKTRRRRSRERGSARVVSRAAQPPDGGTDGVTQRSLPDTDRLSPQPMDTS